MWQKAVKAHVEAGDMVAIGVVQEQHPDRTRLYRQWRQLGWPIFVDSMNTLAHVTVVPIPMAIDEAGIVVHANFRPNQLDAFLERPCDCPEVDLKFNRTPNPDFDALRKAAESQNDSAAQLELGRALFNYAKTDTLKESIAALEQAVKLEPESGAAHFALGTALRRRYETSYRVNGDAQEAVTQWGEALNINPNHYIWRRRLQQYGPRLDKPYNFYFWVEQARREIRERGQTPLQLGAEPMGSEIAAPARRGTQVLAAAIQNPDPKGRINRDTKALVGIETLATPGHVRPGHRVRARLTFRLNEATRPWWNNEADDLLVSLDLPEGLTLVEQQLTFPNPETPETQELRQLEFEIAIDDSVSERNIEFPAYALYYVCADAGGVCYYLRQDFEVSFAVDPNAPTLK